MVAGNRGIRAVAKSPQQGLTDLGNGAYAWLAASNSWGWSNAGLIVDGDQSLLVDTLYDLDLTGHMLKRMHAAEPCTRTSTRACRRTSR